VTSAIDTGKNVIELGQAIKSGDTKKIANKATTWCSVWPTRSARPRERVDGARRPAWRRQRRQGFQESRQRCARRGHGHAEDLKPTPTPVEGPPKPPRARADRHSAPSKPAPATGPTTATKVVVEPEVTARAH